jgi:alkylation response protein AidB-like acyl-CoA dehydrogenase
VAVRNAQANVQVHGGIGFTWEHDAHLFLRRAGALTAFAGPVGVARDEIVTLVDELGVGKAELDMPPGAAAIADEATRFLDEYRATAEPDRHRLVVERGYLYPQWPAPWGRGAGPLERLVVDGVLADIPRYEALGRNVWTLPIVLPTIMQLGTDAQRERWIRPTMDAEVRWCQLFSEPGAGSDLAALQTSAERTDGGWRVSGQKVWTSSAQFADLGFALVRSDRGAARHRGITAMVVDMRAPGVTVRPLRTLSGESHFNEVFLDDVFVPDHDVVGEVHGGWAVAIAMLGHERSSLGSYDPFDGGHWPVIRRRATSPTARVELGDLLAAGLAIRALNLRIATRAITGATEGVEGNVTKLLSTLHHQRAADLGLAVVGSDGVFTDGSDGDAVHEFLHARFVTIAGGTSEILRNVIAERVLGLPRDPRP